jgi:hypothetical protein
VKKHKNDARPSSWSESNSPSIVPLETIHVCLEFIRSDDAEWHEMYPGRERVGSEEGVEFWVGLATKDRSFASIAIYSRIEGLCDCYKFDSE